MPTHFLLAVLLILAAPPPSALDKAIDAQIKSKERVVSTKFESLNRLEAREFRKIVHGKMEREPAVAVQYTLEESLNWTLRLAIIRKRDLRTLADERIGAKGWRSAQLESFDGWVTLKTFSYGIGDPLGNPSVPGETHLSLGEDGRLEEDDSRIQCSPLAPN